MKTILIVNGHPNPKSLCSYFAKIYYENSVDSGFDSHLLNLHELKFDLNLHNSYSKTIQQEFEPDLVLSQQLILKADHLVFIFPSWWASMPAILKGWIDRVFLPGFAFQYSKGLSLPKKLLKNKTARIILTMDAPSWYYRFWNSSPGINIIKKGTLEFSGVKPVKVKIFDKVGSAQIDRIQNWIKEIKNLGAKGD